MSSSKPMEWQPRRLQEWLTQQLGIPGAITVKAIEGGTSNEVYAVDMGQHRWVLRKPPSRLSHHSAHNVLREYRIISTLQKTAVRVPKLVASCEDISVIGTPFYLMDRVPGVVVSDRLPELYRLSPHSHGGFGFAMMDALVEVHSVDWKSLKLSDIGVEDGYLDRQVDRWLSQYSTRKFRELPHLEMLADWLQNNRPPAQKPVLMHGDYRLDNILFSPQPPARVLAIIDWELTTIGDPLLDLALALVFWPGPDNDWQLTNSSMPGRSWLKKLPKAAELATYYASKTGCDIVDLDYYRVMAAWKLAIISESRYARLMVTDPSAISNTQLEEFAPRILDKAYQHVRLAG
jgi:aminoglycoside phosphotransferase (APT) family kinase protein